MLRICKKSHVNAHQNVHTFFATRNGLKEGRGKTTRFCLRLVARDERELLRSIADFCTALFIIIKINRIT